mmetsp:Transcript_44702/g.50117  ORF Transcript_44702/g.50117 Transcript_44702/m.50117 type:complete len:143 (+) Transcript_44702:115-543(+)
MGAWGFGSDENDSTWDSIGFGINERMMGSVELSAEGRGKDGLIRSIVEKDGSDVLNQTGLCILLLKLGCPVPISNLTIVRENLTGEKSEEVVHEGEDSVEERRSIVQTEIALIDAAVANKGSVPGNPIGARGIFTANQMKMK